MRHEVRFPTFVKMKRLPYLLLLSVFLFNTGAYYFVHLHRTHENRKEMKGVVFRNVPQSVLEKISLPVSSARYYEIGNDEIKVNGEFYDIVKKEKIGNVIVYHCINDKTEKKLEADLRKHIREHVSNTSPAGKEKNDASKNVLKDYFPSSFSQSTLLSFSPSILPSFHSSYTPSFFHSPASPPPEFSFSIC